MDPIVVSLASVPRRGRSLKRVIDALLPQCDRLNVYLNGYRKVPRFLLRDEIVIAQSQDHGNRGDAGKFWWSDKLDGPAYYLSADDDLLYPRDYCRRLVAKVEQYRRRGVIGVHGVVLPARVAGGYYGQRRVYPCLGQLSRDTAVHILGTGVLAYHTSMLRVRPMDFRRANMADIWFGILAKRQRIPLICIAHRSGWLADIDPSPTHSISATASRHDAIQARALRQANPWPPPLALPGVSRGTPKATPTIGTRPNIGLRRVHPTSGREFGAKKVGRLTGVRSK